MGGSNVVFVGDGQARALAAAFAPALERVVSGALVFRQIGDGPVPPSDGPEIRFPLLRDVLLWPFRSMHPYVSAGRDPDEVQLGNRIVQRCIDLGWDEERIVAYYRDSYADYRVDLDRMAALDAERVRKRDAASDVAMADRLADFRRESLFSSPLHPLPALFHTLAERLIVAAGDRLPPGFALDPDAFDGYARDASALRVPIDAGVARDLGLAWWHPDDDCDEYVRRFVRDAYDARRNVRERGWSSLVDAGEPAPPIQDLHVVGPVAGFYSDAFTGSSAGFDVEAVDAMAGIVVEAYCPEHHRAPVTIRCTFGTASIEETAAPGGTYSISLRQPMEPGARVSLEIVCSSTVNTFDAGSGPDWRDLGVLILAIRPRLANARKAIFFGNCQAGALAGALSDSFARVGIEARFLAGFSVVESYGPPVTRAFAEDCDVLFEQVDAARFPMLDALPVNCRIVRFPSMGTALLWPFTAINPFYPALFPGNRVLQRCIEAGWDVERTLAYYLSSYEEFRVDLARLAPLDRARVIARDRDSDVHVGDVVADVTAAPAYYDVSHPHIPVMMELARRVIAAAGDILPGHIELSEIDFEWSTIDWERNETPIHPGVARDLGLTWFDPDRTYLRPDGSRLTHDEYVRALIRDMQKNLATRNDERISFKDIHGWHPPIDGARIVGPATGIFPDGLAEASVRFTLAADRPIDGIVVEVYYPPYHARPGRITCSFGAASVEAVVEPGNPVEFVVDAQVATDERVVFSLACSESFNMLESGQGIDARDLALVLIGIRPIASDVALAVGRRDADLPVLDRGPA